ncbi:NADPH-dependent F420 reductase [Nitriliruptor alkaliphilus]|uniref:NADPH-dependent F420 reductase n=1 Tax=Nitriliruptor alkaliphilus TaxID=427918 RepID=UPI0006965C40|nr:NAD(P)-binding domain-containing protein [Nitriliruptor alkaliphilus]
MRVGVLGSGPVARVLAAGFHDHGHDVAVGTRHPSKLANWSAEHDGVRVVSVAEAAAHGEVVVLAVTGEFAAEVLRAAGEDALAGKTVIDTTNPLAGGPPVDGVLPYFTELDDSLMERLQRQFPSAHLVKAFNSVGNQFMVDPSFEGGPPTMFICGDEPAAKRTVTAILDQFGWDVADMGTVVAARVIEPLCALWCIPGMRGDGWNHAFKLLRQPTRGPDGRATA